MKKYLYPLVVLCLSLSLLACGQAADGSQTGDTQTEAAPFTEVDYAAAVKLDRRFVIADCSMASMLASRRRILTLHPNDDMLSDAKPFTVNYASAPSALTAENAEKLIDMEPAEGGLTVNIHKGGEEGCAYAACGSIRDGVFHARDYVIKPVNSEKLFVREGEALHLVDYNCSQGYFDLA